MLAGFKAVGFAKYTSFGITWLVFGVKGNYHHEKSYVKEKESMTFHLKKSEVEYTFCLSRDPDIKSIVIIDN